MKGGVYRMLTLVLTDMRMSDTDGYGVLALLRNSNIGQSGTLPVLAVTARVDSDAARFREAGFAGCLHLSLIHI